MYHEKEVIRLLIKYADNDIIVKIKSEDQLENREIPVVTYILHALLGDEIEFITPEYQEILMLFNDLLKEETTSEKLKEKIIALQKSLPHHEKSSIRKTAIDIYSEDNKEVLNDWGKHNIRVITENDNYQEAVKGAVHKLKLCKVTDLIKNSQEKLKSANEDEQSSIIQKIILLEQIKAQLSEMFGMVILE